jgi:hypothetical protein
VRGSASISSSYEKYKTIVNRELLKVSVLTIRAAMTSNGNSLSIRTDIENLSSSDLTNAALMAVIYEDLGADTQHYVVRDIMPPEIISVSAKQQQTFNLTSDYVSNPSRLKAVVFLRLKSGQVLQAALVATQ